MNVKLSQDKKTVVIELPLLPEPVVSSTGKTKIVASSRGNVAVSLNGRTVYVGVTIFEK